MRARGGSLVLRKGLVAAQVALSFLLLFGAGLFVRSLQNLKTTDTGVALDNLVTFQLSPALNGYDDAAGSSSTSSCSSACIRAGREIGGAGGRADPRAATNGTARWQSRATSAKDGEDMQAFMNALSPGYFETMKIPVLEGRDFRTRDENESANVAIVNRRFAEHFFPARARSASASASAAARSKLNIEIIGVVADSLYEGPREGVRRQVFIPNWGKNGAVFYVRTQTPSASA